MRGQAGKFLGERGKFHARNAKLKTNCVYGVPIMSALGIIGIGLLRLELLADALLDFSKQLPQAIPALAAIHFEFGLDADAGNLAPGFPALPPHP